MIYLLVEDDFAVLLTRFDLLTNPSDAEWVRLWALKESTVAAQHIIHAILSCSVEFYGLVSSCGREQVWLRLPSDEKTIGLSGLEGSVKQKTSARPSEASLRWDGRVPVILL